MIPLKDNVIKHFKHHIMVYLIIIANILIFIFELSMSDDSLSNLITKYGLSTHNINAISILTYQFIHAGWIHILGNMLYLWVFGNTVEDRLGSLRFLIIYLACGMLGGLAQTYLIPDSVPIVGASASIAGVLGVYLLWFPYSKIKVLLPIIVFWTIANVPAIFVLILWFLTNLLNSYASIVTANVDNVAYLGHIVGFLAGVFFAVALIKIRNRFDKV